jgi:hypothetical protein
MRLLIIALVLVTAGVSEAGDDEMIPNAHIYRPLLGKRVTLDGIPFDYRKGVQGRVLLPSGDEVFITDPYLPTAPDKLELLRHRLPQGQLVRVIGTLSLKKFVSKGPLVKGITPQEPDSFSWLALKMESFEVIERAETAYPKLIEK